MTLGAGDGTVTLTPFRYVVEMDIDDGSDTTRVSLGYCEVHSIINFLSE